MKITEAQFKIIRDYVQEAIDSGRNGTNQDPLTAIGIAAHIAIDLEESASVSE